MKMTQWYFSELTVCWHWHATLFILFILLFYPSFLMKTYEDTGSLNLLHMSFLVLFSLAYLFIKRLTSWKKSYNEVFLCNLLDHPQVLRQTCEMSFSADTFDSKGFAFDPLCLSCPVSPDEKARGIFLQEHHSLKWQGSCILHSWQCVPA